MSNSLGEFGIIKIAKRDFDIQQFKMRSLNSAQPNI